MCDAIVERVRLMHSFSCFTLISVFLLASSRTAGGLVVSSWELDTGIFDSADSEFTFFSAAVSPFQDSQTVNYNFSHATTSYFSEWTGDAMHFDAQPSHYLQQHEGRTLSEGRIYVRPAIDSIISLSGTWQFAWPSSVIGATSIGFAVADAQTEEIIATDGANGGNVGIGPPFGTLNIQDSGMLSAGAEYLIYYSAFVDHFDPTPPGTYGEASGEVHFEINPVPESATLDLIALAMPIVFRASRRHRRVQ